MITIRLYKYGIDITNATLQTYAYELGVEKAVSEMTQAEKMQLRMIAILEQSKVSWGDLSNTIQSPSNQLRIFSNNVEEIQLVLGQLFIPVIQRILPLVNGLSVAFKNLLVNIAGMLDIELDLNSFGQGYSETEEEINDIADGFKGATNAVKEWKNQVMGFDEVNPLKDNSAPTDTSGLKEQLDLTEQITDMADEYLKAWQKAYDKMEDKTNEIAKKFEKLFEPVKNFANLFKFGLDTDFKSLGENFMQMTFTNPNRMLQDFIHKIPWNKLGWDIGQFITGSAVESFKAFGETGTTISEAIIGINNFLTNLTNGIEWDVLTIEFINGFTDFLNNLQIGDIIDSFTDTIIAVNDSIIKITKAIIDNPEDFTELFLTLVTKIAELFIAIVNSNINIIANLLGSTFLTLFEDSIDTATGLLKNTDTVLDFLDDTFEDGAESWGNGTFPQFLADKITNIVGGSIGNAKNNLTGIGEMFKPISEEINRSFNNLSEIGDKIGDSLKDAKIRFRNNWRDIINWFRNSAIVEWWETVRDNFSAQNWTENLSGIRSGFETAFETAIDTIQLLWNDLAEWINDALNFDFAGFNKEFNVFGTLYEVGIPNFSVSLGSLPLFNTFANGGFPEDGWFRASHGEYFGKFDNGQSFIANNNQITGGIAESVYPAVFNAVTDAMSMNGNNGEIIVQIDGRNVFRAMQVQANNYTMRTGKEPF